MKWRVTGKARNGRFLEEHDEWEIVQMPPKYFTSRQEAHYYFESMEVGILWRKNDEGSRNQYSVFATLNCKWPEGARARNREEGIYHKRRFRNENMEKQNE